jgi:aminoglycoside 2'-N-acetyltransferase I
MRATLRVGQTEDLLPDERAAVTELCETAFEESWADAWDQVGPGLHVLAEAEGHAVAHAMIIDRRVYLGHEPDLALDVGYVEWVATRPEAQREGHGTRVMREIGRIIVEEYALGALATGSNPFYERLGWETWRGPTFVRMPDGERVRSIDEDGQVMVLRTPRTPELDLGGPIAVDWRAADPW